MEAQHVSGDRSVKWAWCDTGPLGTHDKRRQTEPAADLGGWCCWPDVPKTAGAPMRPAVAGLLNCRLVRIGKATGYSENSEQFVLMTEDAE